LLPYHFIMTSFHALIGVIFSTPLAALAVAGGVAAAPIIIHLLNRKRYVVVPWAAMRFLLAAQKRNVRRLHLEQWLLLAVRVAIGLSIVTAMIAIMPWAEPIWLKLVPGKITRLEPEGRTHRIIVIDGGFTMDTRVDGEGNRFALAKEQAKAVLGRSAPGDGFSLIFLTSTAQAIVPGPADDSAKVAEEIDGLELPHGSADTVGGQRLALDMASRPLGRYARREVVFITDLRRSGWPLAPASSSAETPASSATLAELGKAARLIFIDVARRDVDNVSVSGLTLGDPLPLVDATTSVTAVIQNFGKRDLEKCPVDLRVGRAPKPGEKLVLKEIGQKLADVKAGSSVPVTFVLENQNRFREAGDYVLQVQAGEDDLRPDNVRTLALTVRDTIPVLVVNGKIAVEPLETPGEWVRQALRPGQSNVANSESPVLPTLITADQFADRFRADLTKFDCVFLCDLPSISLAEADRLDAHLRRGGSVVIGLGPNAARNLDEYNRVLFNEGKGLLPGKLLGVKRAEGKDWYSLYADEDAFKAPPLNACRSERERAALTLPQFHQYVRLQAPVNGPARRIFSFQPQHNDAQSEPAAAQGAAALDPAVVDFPRHRGRVIVYTSTFNPERLGRDRFWSNWPPHPTFLPFWHETLRYAVAVGQRRNLQAGEALEEFLPAAMTGLKASLIRGAGAAETLVDSADVISRDESAVVAFTKTDLSGIYRVSTVSRPDSLFAVNVPVTAPGGGAESDLRRWTASDLKTAAPDADLQVADDAGDIQAPSQSPSGAAMLNVEKLEPQGSNVARLLLSAAFLLMVLEVYLAWHFGSARASNANIGQSPPTPRPIATTLAWLLPTIGSLCLLGTWAHAMITDDFLGFLPSQWRHSLERALEVPQAAPGEATRWRLKSLPYVSGPWKADRWIVGSLAFAVVLYVFSMYRKERIGYLLSAGRRFWSDPRIAPAVLRIQLMLVMLFILLPQLQLLFEREAWPDIVIMLDDSRSMSVVEPFADPILREKTDELKKTWAEIAKPRIERANLLIAELRAKIALQPSAPAAEQMREQIAGLEKHVDDWKTPHRLNLVKALLASGSQDWFQTLLRERKVHVHVYRASSEATPLGDLADLSDPEQCSKMLDEIFDIIPEGEASRQGDALNAVLKTFRGKSLTAIIMFTDGQKTKGEEPSQAASLARRMKSPLFFVGVGDNTPSPDIIVSDLRAEREINVNDRLVFDVRVAAQGAGMPRTVPVNLLEIVDGKQVLRESKSVQISDRPVRLTHVPTTPGDKLYVVEVPVQEGETDERNNRIEHEVHVSETKQVRVLMIESAPRYEFRFVKSLFERALDQAPGNKSIEVSVLLTGANREYFKQDKNAIAEFPAWEDLKNYDVIVLGDVDPASLPRGQAQLKMIADFVKERAGGLLFIAGEHFSPYAYAGTDLADVLPVTTEGIAPPPAPKSTDSPLTRPYRPSLTGIGQNHPVFRFVGDESENAAIWNKLPEMLWCAKGYRRKLSAEALAVHPELHAEGGGDSNSDELHPLVLQQFVGGGRVMFFGFDETWRWRFRGEEPRFNQFWIQTIRSLARRRVGRIEISVPEKVFRRDNPIRITVRFPDDAPAPPPKELVEVQIERRPLQKPGRERSTDEPEIQRIQLAAKPNTRATYEALLTQTAEGEYRFVLASPASSGRPPKTEATVLPQRGEMEDTRLNESDLRKAAAESSGEYFPLNQASELLSHLPDVPRIALDQPCPPLPLWNHPATFAVVFSLLLTEWLLRKRARLL
jgi:Aerotolerance regulator N-terminal/von Willebrand factor type A domain